MLKASIVIPSYKSKDSIYQAVYSSLSQGERVKEVIVVIDGVFDETEEILNKIKDERLRIVVFEHNKGAQIARNTGLKLASSEYILFLDSDDYFEPNFIDDLFSAIENSNQPDICFGSMRVLEQNNRVFTVNIPKDILWEELLISRLISVNIVGIHSILWRKEFVEKIGGWSIDVVRNQDGEFVIRALLKTKRFVIANDSSAAIYYQHNNNNRISRKRTLESFQSQIVIYEQLNEYLTNNKDKNININKIYAGLLFFCINKCIGLSREGFIGEEYEIWKNKIKWRREYLTILPKEKFIQVILFFLFNKKAYKLIDVLKKFRGF